ncbi:MAG TPA: serine/threonine-protein kinase [Micromonosporaceae bacterium]|nr:serine/threonine-protein kinase [Micromonosporaceae bacterium]
MLASGHLLGERYRLDERLADGGMGDVWRATDQVLGREVAVKLLRPELLAEPGFAARFRAEAQMMAALRHPGVVDVYDYGDDTDRPDGVAYLVMAYVDGQPLSARIAEAGRLGASETMAVVAQAARALHAAHSAGIVHRDVKPANLLVEADGRVVLVDFGVAHSTGTTSHTGLNEVVGTALYMAPEQVTKQALSPATDVYALGAVAYHCLAGRPPFTGDSPVQVALRHLEAEPPPLPDDVPEPVQELVRRAMAKDPADRFPDAAAFVAAVEATGLAGAPVGLAADAGQVSGGLAADAAGPTVALVRPAGGPAQPGEVEEPARSGEPRRARRHLPAAAVVAALLGLAVLAVLVWPGWDTPMVPGPDRPPAGPPASVSPGTPGAGGGAPGAVTSPPGSGAASPGATPASPSGPAVTTARTTGAPAPPPRTSPPPPSAAPTPAPPGLSSSLPSSLPASSP